MDSLLFLIALIIVSDGLSEVKRVPAISSGGLQSKSLAQLSTQLYPSFFFARLNDNMEKHGMKINTSKTKVMVTDNAC